MSEEDVYTKILAVHVTKNFHRQVKIALLEKDMTLQTAVITGLEYVLGVKAEDQDDK